MGSDNLFHKRKAKRKRELQRRKARRAPYARVLIVCEGEKTEPYYFEAMRQYYRLNSANIYIAKPGKGNDPLSIVSKACELYQNDPDFDRIFCVFDRDAHTTYEEALEKIRGCLRRKKRVLIEAVCSVPCFEIWPLLHFKYTSRPFRNCDAITHELKNFIPDYQKSARTTFHNTRRHVESAVKHGYRLEDHKKASGSENPSTSVHKVVDFLIHLKDSP